MRSKVQEKPRFLFEVMNALAGQGYKCLFYSLEGHPASQLFKDKVKQYIQPENLSNISVIDEVEETGMMKKRILKIRISLLLIVFKSFRELI